MRKIDEVTDLPQDLVDERRKCVTKDSLPKHQRIQMLSQKLQSLQDQKNQYQRVDGQLGQEQ